MANNTTRRFELLDLMRGVAALWVMLFHYHYVVLQDQAAAWYTHGLRGGYLGVAIFFVISGYCMSISARRGVAEQANGFGGKVGSVKRFLWKRGVRILPPFWLSVALFGLMPVIDGAVGWLVGDGFALSGANWQVMRQMGLGEWLGMLTLTSGLLGGDAVLFKNYAFNTVYWSLSIELQFYIVVALGMLLGRHWRLAMLGVTLVSLGAIQSGGWFSTGAFVGTQGWVMPGLFLPYWPMFALGMLTEEVVRAGGGWRGHGGQTGRQWAAGFWTLWLAILFAGQCDTNLVMAAITAAALWFAAGANVQETMQRIKAGWLLGVMLLLGRGSYSVYLGHKLMFVSAIKISSAALVAVGLAANGVLYLVVVGAVSVGMCLLFYAACEKPFSKLAARTSWQLKSTRNKQALGGEQKNAAALHRRSACNAFEQAGQADQARVAPTQIPVAKNAGKQTSGNAAAGGQAGNNANAPATCGNVAETCADAPGLAGHNRSTNQHAGGRKNKAA